MKLHLVKELLVRYTDLCFSFRGILDCYDDAYKNSPTCVQAAKVSAWALVGFIQYANLLRIARYCCCWYEQMEKSTRRSSCCLKALRAKKS